jgi:ABC-type nitrate/sulfonate/bicarbonate transport system substrate-binding protein
LKSVAKVSIVIVLIFLVIGGTFVFLNVIKSAPTTLESVTVGHVPIESFGLLYVAKNQGFFVDNGLNVTIQDYSTGATAVAALTSGAVDVSGSSEYVVALNAVGKQNISIIASCGETNIVDLIGRNDHGIVNPSDLNGKKIATAKGTIAEFYLGRFLEANSMSIENITLIYMSPTDFAPAIVNGSTDAVVSWQSYTEQVKAQLGTGFVDWPLQINSPFYSVLSCRNDWLTSNPQTVSNLLNALQQAEDYLNSHPTEAQQIIKKRFNYTDDYMTTVWSRNTFGLSLTQKLTQVMQEEAIWMINNNLTNQTTTPTITNYISTTALKAIKPQAVTIP